MGAGEAGTPASVSRFPATKYLEAFGIARDQIGALRYWAEVQDGNLRLHYSLGLVAAVAFVAGLVTRRTLPPWLEPQDLAHFMVQEADRRVALALPAERAHLYGSFLSQIEHWHRGMWSYRRVPQPDGGVLFVGSIGYGRLVDPAGRIWKGRLANPGQVVSGEAPVWEVLVQVVTDDGPR
jgi:hypothetical protein